MNEKRNKKKNYYYEREKWLNFVKFANSGKVNHKSKVLIDKQSFNPFNATLDDVANFVHFIFDMSSGNYAHFTEYLRVLDHYLPNLELGKYTCQLTVHHETFLSQRPATCFINKVGLKLIVSELRKLHPWKLYTYAIVAGMVVK